MKYCKNCGAPLSPNQKVCTKCGNKVIQNSEESNVSPLPQSNTINRKSKKQRILLYLILFLLASLIAAYLLLQNHYSPQNQAKNISEAIKSNDDKKLTDLLTSDSSEKMTQDDAKAYLKYLSDTNNTVRVASEVTDSVKRMSSFNDAHTEINIDGENVLSLYRDGKIFGLFNKIAFQVPRKDVYLYTENPGQLEFKYNGNKKSVDLKEYKNNNIGKFYLGNRDIKAQKIVKDKPFNGLIKINMQADPSATEQFDFSKLSIDIINDYLVDDVKLFIDKKETTYNHGTTYGPFEKDKKIEVYATGTVDDKKIETDKQTVTLTDDTTQLDLSFDSDLVRQIHEETSAEEEKKYKDSVEEKQKAEEEKQAEEDSETDSSDKSSDSKEETDTTSDIDLTVNNAIDIVENYEGHSLDTDKYTFKTPVENSKGVGFSFLDKDGNLAGSYQILKDGTVIKYDEDGKEIGRGSGR